MSPCTSRVEASNPTREELDLYMPLVRQVVARVLRKLPPNVLREDLISAGTFGLIDALRKSVDRGPAFEWYARVRIRGAVVDELRAQDWLTRRARSRITRAQADGTGGSAAVEMCIRDSGMEAGVEDPEPLTGPPGPGRIPRDPAVYRRVAAAFNGAFKTEHGHYGMMVKKRVLLPPVPASATVIVLDDGRVGFGTWGSERKVGGVQGVPDDAIVSFRQNLDPLVDHGQINPTGRNLWGFTLPGKGAQTERSGMCVTTSGHLLYAWGDDVSATALAKAMEMAGCDYAMHLDMNPYHTGFLFTAIDDIAGKKYKSQLLTPAMSIPTDRYIQYAPKDFFYVMVHDPTPGSIDGGVPWTPDGGLQPPPHWMPGIWSGRVDGVHGSVEIVDIEPGRVTWRVRAGTKDATAATPRRELTGDDSRRALLAVGLGVASEKRALGLATSGRMAVAVRGGPGSGAVFVGDDGDISIVRADDTPILGDKDDLVELPLLLSLIHIYRRQPGEHARGRW